jgi:predicted ATPase
VTSSFVRSVVLKRDEVADFGSYPFSIPAIRDLEQLDLHAGVTLARRRERQRQVDPDRGNRSRCGIQCRGRQPEHDRLDTVFALAASRALSLRGNLALMRRMHDLVAGGSQFVVSTHSPILLGYPEARTYVLSLHHLFADD